jgi:hypothetical protein
MSQLLIVQNSAPEADNRLFAEGVSLFHRLCELRPSDRVAGARLAISVFPRMVSPRTVSSRTKERSSVIVRAKSSGRWLGGAGTWFYKGVSAEEGLRKLLDDEQFSTDNPDGDLRDLDGQFVLASGDCNSGDLTVVTDRLGILHVYAVQIGSSQVISTSSMVLATLAGAEWDAEGCRQFLASGNIFEPARSLFRGVRKLEDARIYRFTDGLQKLPRRYWSIESVLGKSAESAVGVPQVAAALQESLCVVQRNFPKPLLDFTGGFDTRGLVGAMLNADLNLDLSVNGPDDSADVVASTGIARELGLRHHHRFRGFSSAQQWWDRAKESVAYCDGECDALRYGGTLEAHLRNSEGFDASVNGAIGEVLKGHWWELLFPHTGRKNHFDCHKVAARRFTFEGEIPGLLAFEYATGLTDYYAQVIRQAISGLERFPNTAVLDAVYLILRQQKWLGRTVSATDRIWPCISPYGFRWFLELAISAPAAAKLRHRMTRRLIEYESPELARLPLPGGYPAGPLRLGTLPQFWPVLQRYRRLVVRRLLIEAKLRKRERIVAVAYPNAAQPFSQLIGLEEVGALLDPAQMRTGELYNGKVLRVELNKCRGGTPVQAYRLGRMLTLELLARRVCNARGSRADWN